MTPSEARSRPFALARERILALLPHGHGLSEASWKARHRAILVVLWGHAVAVPLYGIIMDYSVWHSLLEGFPIAVAAAFAAWGSKRRRPRSGAATAGLLFASAILVHFSGGLIEMHFHFFVMVPLVALYQDWSPFLAAIGYVLLHHGAAGAIDPTSVYNHPAALASPWKWAAVHALFIAATSVVCLATWRMNETALERSRAAERELREALALLSTTLDSTADGVLVVDGEGAIRTYNQRFREMWGIPPEVLDSEDDEAALGYVLDQLAEPEAFLDKVRELYASPEAESLDEIEFKDGRIFERLSQPHRIDGESIGRVWSFRDITDRKETERTLREALHRDREAVERLRSLDESKSLLLTAVSHELRTPLATVRGFAQTLYERDADLRADQRRDFLQRLLTGAERLEQLVLNLFDLDRVSRGIMEPRRDTVELDELIRRVLDHLDIPRHPITADLEPTTAELDTGMVERVVENLLVNAAKHTPPGTDVTVRLRSDDTDAVISVEDNGPGVPDELKETIFEPFRQGDVPSHSPGTGVGLALVARFTELHGGEARVMDGEGGGAVFRLTLPKRAGDDEQVAASLPPAPVSRIAERRPEGRRSV